MSIRRPTLSLALVLCVGVLLLAVLFFPSPRLRPDLIHFDMQWRGARWKSVPVKLVELREGNPDCQSAGMEGITNIAGSYEWTRLLPERPLLGIGPQVDEIAVCARLRPNGTYELLWQRRDLRVQERLDLTCDAAGAPGKPCAAEYTMTLPQLFEFTTMGLLIAWVTRVLWNRKSVVAARVGLVFLLPGVLAAGIAFCIAVSPWTRMVLTACVVGGLVGIHGVFSRLVDSGNQAAEALETRNSGVSGS